MTEFSEDMARIKAQFNAEMASITAKFLQDMEDIRLTYESAMISGDAYTVEYRDG